MPRSGWRRRLVLMSPDIPSSPTLFIKREERLRPDYGLILPATEACFTDQIAEKRSCRAVNRQAGSSFARSQTGCLRGSSYGQDRFRRVYRVVRHVRMQNYILAFLLTAAGAKAELSRLDALSLIESGDNDAAVGRAGEVSRFQIMPHVWSHYSGSRAFRNTKVSTTVAAMHLQELTTWFQQRTGRAASDFDIYVLWNAGPTYYHRIGFKTSRVNRVITERARRYAALRATTPTRQTETVIAATTLQKPATPPATKLPTVAVAKSIPPKGPLWPVFEQPPVPAARSPPSP